MLGSNETPFKRNSEWGYIGEQQQIKINDFWFVKHVEVVLKALPWAAVLFYAEHKILQFHFYDFTKKYCYWTDLVMAQ